MLNLTRELNELSLKRQKPTPQGGDLFKAPWHIVYYHIVPYLDARALAQLSLADIACSYLQIHRRDYLRQKIFQVCQDDENIHSPKEFAWDACWRDDFRWRFHTAWLAGVHINDVLFYNHFTKRRCRAIDSVERGSPQWNFLVAHGAWANDEHSTFGCYPPLKAQGD